MADALFSEFVMVDHPAAAPAAAQRAALMAALVDTLAEPLPGGGARPAGSACELQALAADVADIIAGPAVILRLAPAAAGDGGAAVKVLLEQLMRVTGGLDASRQEAAIARLADIILPDALADARGALAADNLALRDRFIAETAPLSSAAVASRAGYTGNNPYATAARWKKAGDIFSVHHRGGEYFPAFQFREGRPHPAMRGALAGLPATLSAWQRAFWFVSANGWLAGRAPAEALDDPAAVIAAARQEAEEVVG